MHADSTRAAYCNDRDFGTSRRQFAMMLAQFPVLPEGAELLLRIGPAVAKYR